MEHLQLFFHGLAALATLPFPPANTLLISPSYPPFFLFTIPFLSLILPSFLSSSLLHLFLSFCYIILCLYQFPSLQLILCSYPLPFFPSSCLSFTLPFSFFNPSLLHFLLSSSTFYILLYLFLSSFLPFILFLVSDSYLPFPQVNTLLSAHIPFIFSSCFTLSFTFLLFFSFSFSLALFYYSLPLLVNRLFISQHSFPFFPLKFPFLGINILRIQYSFIRIALFLFLINYYKYL